MNPMTQTQKTKEIHRALGVIKGSFFVTGQDANILYTTSSILLRTGYSAAEAVGRKPRQLWGGIMDQRFYESMWKTIQDGKKPFVATIRNTHKSGKIFEQNIYIAPILSGSQEVEWFIDLHPYLGDGRSQADFAKEFFDIFSSQNIHAHHIMAWALPWLCGGKSDRDRLLDVLNSIKQEQQDFSGFIRDVLIRGTKEQFANRKTDMKLVRSAQEDQSQFHRLYTKYKHDIFHYFLERTDNDMDLSQELTQETFLRAFKSLSSFRVLNASYKTYLLRISHNILLNQFRKKSTVSLESLPTELISCPSRYETVHRESIIWKSLSVLSAREKEIFVMKYKKNLMISEIAALVQMSENAVKLHLCRARKKLRAFLSP